MLDCTPTLATLLENWRNNTNAAPFAAELYTWTLVGGDAIRWTSADLDIAWNGHVFARGPGIERSQITRQTGTSTSELEVTLYMDDAVTRGGVTLAAFIAGGGFVNAILSFERAYAAAPGSPIAGTLPKFKGRVVQIKSAGETKATLVVSNWMSLLNVQVPVDVWQPPCLHTVFDAGCTLNRADYAVQSTVKGGSDALTIYTELGQKNGWFDLGKMVFTSGANAGQSRTVKAQSGGVVALVRPLPQAPAPGDKFTAYPGCDLTMATCSTKFSNLIHFKGYPFIPLNEMAAP